MTRDAKSHDEGLIRLLDWYMEAGADEAIAETPVDRFAATTAPPSPPPSPPPPPQSGGRSLFGVSGYKYWTPSHLARYRPKRTFLVNSLLTLGSSITKRVAV